MPDRIPQTTFEIISGREETANYLKMQKRLGRFYLKKFFDILTEQNKSGRFLEIGSGSGYQTAEIAQDYPGAEIVAVEPSFDMITVALDYLAGRGLEGRVHFIHGLVENESLFDTLGEFDLVYSTFSLHHWTDAAKAFSNLNRVLKPGGTALIYDFRRSWLSWNLPLSPGMVDSIRAAYTPEEICTLLARADIRNYRISSNFPYLAILIQKTHPPRENPAMP